MADDRCAEIRHWLTWRARRLIPHSDAALAAGLDARTVERIADGSMRWPRRETVDALDRVMRGDPRWTALRHAERREANAEAGP